MNGSSPYARAGWPDATPGYAIRGYPALLAAITDITRLSALARNPRRHAFLLLATGSDYAALTEIRTIQSLTADQSVLDLQALIEMAACRHVISVRNQSVPAELPIVWARLARFDRAEALARTITDTYSQARALTGLATVIAQAGDPDRAEALAAPSPTPAPRPGLSPGWPPRSPRPETLTAPRPSPAPSPTPAPRPGLSPGWPPRSPRPETPAAPRPSPAPSPTPAPGRRRSPGWPP